MGISQANRRHQRSASGTRDAEAAPEKPGYEPADHNVADVAAYAAKHPAELEGIISREQAGKNRTTLMRQLIPE